MVNSKQDLFNAVFDNQFIQRIFMGYGERRLPNALGPNLPLVVHTRYTPTRRRSPRDAC